MRLTSSQIALTMKQGDKKHQRYVVTYIRPGQNNAGCIIIGKRVSKKAVVRNRIKRQLSHYLHQKFQQQQVGHVVLRVTSPELTVNQVGLC
ncbi:ribonuclease P protein component [Gammaproteobacteria bacterium]|nr:ribonuclease P protein component [Gammaproteobacteria bacterium]